MVLGSKAAADRLSDTPASAHPLRAAVRLDRAPALLAHQAARELCRHHELRHLPDVFCLLSTLSLVACKRIKPASLLHLPVESVHSCSRAHPLLALWQSKLGG